MATYTTIRLDDALGQRLQALAEQSGMSAGALARRLIEAALAGGQIESNAAYAALYGDGDDRSTLVSLARRWLPDGHPELWRVYGRADGPWAAPDSGHGDEIDAMIASAHVLAPYRMARERRPCASRELAIAVAATSGLSEIVVEATGDADGGKIVNLGVGRLIVRGNYYGFRLPSPSYSISLRFPEADLSELVLENSIVTDKNIRNNHFLQFLLALAVIGDVDWRTRGISAEWPPLTWAPPIRLRVVATERRRRGRGWQTYYRTRSIPFSSADAVAQMAEEAARSLAGERLPDIVSAAADAGRIAYDKKAMTSYQNKAKLLLDWLISIELTSPLALLDWVPCVWQGGIVSSLRRVTHLDTVHARPQLPEALKETSENFLDSEGVRRAAVGLLFQGVLDR